MDGIICMLRALTCEAQVLLGHFTVSHASGLRTWRQPGRHARPFCPPGPDPEALTGREVALSNLEKHHGEEATVDMAGIIGF